MKRQNNLFDNVLWAKKILGISDLETKKDVQKKYRELSRKFHPDKCPEPKKEECAQKMTEINEAYKILKQYMEEYLFGFTEEELKKQDPNSDFKNRFLHDWNWGDGN